MILPSTLRLHDCEFVSANCTWQEKTSKVEVLIVVKNEFLHIIFDDVSLFRLPHWNHWGPSSTISEITDFINKDGEIKTIIKMNSGDKIMCVSKLIRYKYDFDIELLVYQG